MLWSGNARGVKSTHGIVERAHAAALGVVGRQAKDIVFVLEVALGQGLQGALGADLEEDARALAVAGFDALDELDRRRHLVGQPPSDGFHVVGRVELPVDIADERNAGWGDLHLADGSVERVRGGRDHFAVKGVRDGDDLRGHAHVVEVLDRAIHGVAGAGDHRLLLAIHVGRREVAADLGQAPHNFVGRPEHRSHLALVADGHRRHGPRPRAHGDQGLGKVEHARAHCRRPLAQAVPHHHVREHAVLAKHTHNGDVGGYHGRLANGRILERLLSGFHGRRVVGVPVHIAGQRLAEDGPHGAVGFCEGLAHDGIGHVGEHVDVLGSLARKQERHLAGRAATEVNALGL